MIPINKEEDFDPAIKKIMDKLDKLEYKIDLIKSNKVVNKVVKRDFIKKVK